MKNTSMADMNSFNTKIAALRQRYAEQVSSKIEAIVRSWKHYCASPNREDFEHLLMEVHRIAGTAKTYGFPNLGELASQLEKCLIDEGVALPSQNTHLALKRLENYSTEYETKSDS